MIPGIDEAHEPPFRGCGLLKPDIPRMPVPSYVEIAVVAFPVACALATALRDYKI